MHGANMTIELYLYSPYGPYGQHRASVPVQGSNYETNCILKGKNGEYIPCLKYSVPVFVE